MIAYVQTDEAVTVLGDVTGTLAEQIDEARRLAAACGVRGAVCLAARQDRIPTFEQWERAASHRWRKGPRPAPGS